MICRFWVWGARDAVDDVALNMPQEQQLVWLLEHSSRNSTAAQEY
jgi:hypothetical protein